MLAFPARYLAIFPLTHLGERLTCGIEKSTAPCFGGGAPRLCADIAAWAPSTCRDPEGIRASLSLPPAKETSLDAEIGPNSALKDGM